MVVPYEKSKTSFIPSKVTDSKILAIIYNAVDAFITTLGNQKMVITDRGSKASDLSIKELFVTFPGTAGPLLSRFYEGGFKKKLQPRIFYAGKSVNHTKNNVLHLRNVQNLFY